MKTFKQMIHESRYGKTEAIMSSRSKIHPDKADQNEFHKDWQEYAKGKPNAGTYLHLSQEIYNKKGIGKKHIILSGSGHPDGYAKEGDRINAHHAQTGASAGHWKVEQKVPHEKISDIKHKKSMPLYVYK